MAVAPVIMKTNPHRPVDFKESAVAKCIAESGNVNVEVKEDGCQLNMVVYYESMPELTKGWTVKFLSREGKEFNGLSELAAKLTQDERWIKFFNPHLDGALFRDQGGFLLQAEILTLDEAGNVKPCAEIAGDLRRMQPIPTNRMVIVGYDLIPLDVVRAGTDYEVFQEVRMGHLRHQIEALSERFKEIKWRVVESAPAFSMVGLMALYENYRAQGKEGGVAKDPLGYWKRGKKTGQWKVKPDDECDGTVVGLMWGTPGLANEGKVIGFTVLTEHGVEVDAGGLTEAQKDEYTDEVFRTSPGCQCCEEGFFATGGPFEGRPVKITYMERLPSGSYRHPNFHSFRGITDPMTKE